MCVSRSGDQALLYNVNVCVGVYVTLPLQIPQQGIHISLAFPQMPVYLLNGCYLQTCPPKPMICMVFEPVIKQVQFSKFLMTDYALDMSLTSNG